MVSLLSQSRLPPPSSRFPPPASMDSQALVILLRLVHLLAGIFWVGGVIVLSLFVLPAQRAIGEDNRFLKEIMVGQKLSTWFGISAGLSVLAGLVLYGRNVSLSDGAWASTMSAMTFGLGGALAVLAMIIGGGVSGRAQRRMALVGQEIAAAGGPPSAAQRDELALLNRRVALGSKLTLGLLLGCTVLMAVARYV